MADTPPSLDLLYSETRDRIIRQSQEMDALSTKASIILGFDAVAIAATLSVLMAEPTVGSRLLAWLHFAIVRFWSLAALLATGVSLALAVAAYWCREYKEVLDPTGAYTHLATKSPDEAKRDLLHAMIASYGDNRRMLLRMASHIRHSLGALVLSVGFYIMGALSACCTASLSGAFAEIL